MVSVKGYISSNFTKSFLTIFLPFFIIISLVFLVRIAALTAKIQISFSELLLLYSFSIPEIFFYTLPLSFIASLANLLIRLSQDNELIALYALGLKSKKILRNLLILGLLFTLLLASVSLLAMPLSKQFYRSFKEEKKQDAKLNIVPGKLGQRFGNYYIYVKEKKKEIFHDIVIYNRSGFEDEEDEGNPRKKKIEVESEDENETEQFFSSQTGQLKRKNGITSLVLNEGYGYTYSENKLQQAKYRTMEIFDTSEGKKIIFEDMRTYWSALKTDIKLLKKLLFFTFVSFIPLLSVYLIAAFTMINPRYQKNHSFIVIFVTTLSLYLVASSIQRLGSPLVLVISIVSIFALGQWLFHRRVARYF